MYKLSNWRKVDYFLIILILTRWLTRNGSETEAWTPPLATVHPPSNGAHPLATVNHP